jgi:hypothetical protein
VRRAGIDDQLGFETLLGVDHAAQGRAGVVLTHQADQHRLGAERRDVAGHVARAAQHGGFLLDRDHRHRRLGRDAVDRAIDEAVQHHVAEHQHGLAGEGAGQVGEGVIHTEFRTSRPRKLNPRRLRRTGRRASRPSRVGPGGSGCRRPGKASSNRFSASTMMV